MPLGTYPEWERLALYAVAAAATLLLLCSIPRVGAVIRAGFSMAMLAFGLFVIFQQAPYEPNLARLADKLGVYDQEVAGDEVRIRMSPDGHFWAQATLNGVPRRMLIDSGATVTALSSQSAQIADVERDANVLPVMMRTANGVVRAEAGTVEALSLGAIEARNLKVVISPALGGIDVLGMNFLSQLASWRVEGRILVLTPHTHVEGDGSSLGSTKQPDELGQQDAPT